MIEEGAARDPGFGRSSSQAPASGPAIAKGPRKPSVWSLLPFLMLCGLAAASGSAFPPGEWYETLEKPSWTPPNIVFPIVWTILYAGIAWAGWRYWVKAGWSWVVGLWGLQLALNAAWSWLFFGLHLLGPALFEIRVLSLVIVTTIVLGWRVSRPASIVMLVYLLWVAFASWLNFEIWALNA